MLSLHSKIYSDAERHAIVQAEGVHTFRKIGAGECGAIFARDGESLVIKLAKGDDDELWNDYVKHATIATSFKKYAIDTVSIPECYFFVPRNKNDYFEQYPGLLKASESIINPPTSALVTERIHSLPQVTRASLIEKYCASRIKEHARADPANQDCLVRVYLGSMQGKAGAMFFSLRNFKLHLNQIVELELDVEPIARRMGIALAIMHWAAMTDARDIEFVLGMSSKKTATTNVDPKTLEPHTYTGPPSLRHEDFFRQTTELWVLDFNQVRSITLDDAGVAQAVEAVGINDPYFPKPLGESPTERYLWKAFVMSYLDASQVILEEEVTGKEVLALPRKFILGITNMERAKMSRCETEA